MDGKFSERTSGRLRQFGDELREVRRKASVSRVALAGRLKMHPMNYARIEQGKQNVTFDTLLRVADALDVELQVKLVPRETAQVPGRRQGRSAKKR